MGLFFPISILLVQEIIIWASVKAKPLADKLYRWATYDGITTGIVAFSLFSFSIMAFKKRASLGNVTFGDR